jgi:hypothetical protein
MIVSVVIEDRRRKLQDAPKTFQELLAYTAQAFQPCLDSFADKLVNFQAYSNSRTEFSLLCCSSVSVE